MSVYRWDYDHQKYLAKSRNRVATYLAAPSAVPDLPSEHVARDAVLLPFAQC
jgi:hypothetical protein